MYRLLLIFCLLVAAPARAQQPPAAPAEQIRAILATQAAAWNRGDVAAYMQAGYWPSDSLLFVGQNGPTYGYQATLDRYRQRYPDAARMGQLTFDGLQIRLLSPASAFVVGRWALQRAAGNLAGYFTLLFQKKQGRWVIVADHSS